MSVLVVYNTFYTHTELRLYIYLRDDVEFNVTDEKNNNHAM